MGILLLPLPCQQTSAYNMKETMLKTKTKTDTNDNTNSSLHKLVHYSYEQCLNASVLRIISSIINESSMNNIRFLVNNIVVNTHVCDLIKLFLTSISDTLYLLRSKSWVTLIGNQANLFTGIMLFVFSYLLHSQMQYAAKQNTRHVYLSHRVSRAISAALCFVSKLKLVNQSLTLLLYTSRHIFLHFCP